MKHGQTLSAIQLAEKIKTEQLKQEEMYNRVYTPSWHYDNYPYHRIGAPRHAGDNPRKVKKHTHKEVLHQVDNTHADYQHLMNQDMDSDWNTIPEIAGCKESIRQHWMELLGYCSNVSERYYHSRSKANRSRIEKVGKIKRIKPNHRTFDVSWIDQEVEINCNFLCDRDGIKTPATHLVEGCAMCRPCMEQYIEYRLSYIAVDNI